MAKRLRPAAAWLAVCCLLITGCSLPAGLPGQKDTAQDEAQSLLPPTAEPLKQDPVQESGETTDEPGDAAQQEEPVILPDVGSVPFGRPPVENNGGYFVRVGNEVWFRRQNMAALETTAVWSDFIDAPVSADEPPASMMYSCDLVTGEVTKRIEDVGGGYGPLYYRNGGFYSVRYVGGEQDIYWFSLDGTEIRELCAGWIQDMMPDGGLVVMGWEDGAGYLAVYDGEERRAKYSAGDDSIVYCGSADGDVFFILNRYADGSSVLMQLLSDGSMKNLGEIPPRDIDYDGGTPECEDFLYDLEALSGDPEQDVSAEQTGYVYLLAAWREGTGHYLAERRLFRARPGRTDSLEPFEAAVRPRGDTQPEIAYLCMDAPEKPQIVELLPGSAVLSEDVEGDLLLIDSVKEQTRVARNFLKRTAEPDENGNDGGIYMPQTLEAVGGTVFGIIALTERAPEDDIGWREAYTLQELEYFRLPVRGYGDGELLIRDGEGVKETIFIDSRRG